MPTIMRNNRILIPRAAINISKITENNACLDEGTTPRNEACRGRKVLTNKSRRVDEIEEASMR